MTWTFDVTPNPQPRSAAERAEVLGDLGFGKEFTDHMALATWTLDGGWSDDKVVAYGPITLDPATAVLHYGQEVFEGLKAYRHEDGSIWLFRPERNAERFNRSAARLGLPELPTEAFLKSIEQLLSVDKDWVPDPAGGESSLYLRPFMFASEAFVGVRASHHVTYCLIASPAGPYFSTGVAPVKIWVTNKYSRAGRGGTGAAKCGGNYASSLLAQQEATEHGCAQVLFADAGTHTHVEELGGMNIFVVTTDGELVTPQAGGTILEGVTRSSILELATERGLRPVEREFGMSELFEGVDSGRIAEVFACGTAAVITPIGEFLTESGETHTVAGGGTGEHTLGLRQTLLDIQYGRIPDTRGWTRRIA
ncbi:branched-chain amino acid aminotransferase [Granulicoccus phenolivorans]|uniref:branched-chain amino acid aminotransferase n=1 Tax=Granulicoccus phenolivorans TaxID=266854 RepID=UPI00047CA51D|nr:branched-chain amino acid aminotransferase [Granulicoccus phenolivorans]